MTNLRVLRFLPISFRPAYQDELDELQTDLKILYDEYAIKYRNAVYLEQLLEEERKNQPQAEQIMIDHENDGPALDDPGLEVTVVYVSFVARGVPQGVTFHIQRFPTHVNELSYV